MAKNYYDILGITDKEKELTGADFSAIVNKKYKKLALKWHPDRWINATDKEKKEAEERFKEISEANSILSDPQKREEYDYGENINFNGFDAFDIFRQMYNGSAFSSQVKKGTDIFIQVEISLDEAFKGGKKTIKYSQNKECKHCEGTGSSDKKVAKCPHCNGTGRIMNTVRKGNMVMQNITVCPYCHGTGSINPNPCKYCNGTGYEESFTNFDLQIPSGIDNGMRIMLKGKGNPIKNGINGDLIIEFVVKPDEYFERIDMVNLVHVEEVPFNDALLGFEKEVKTIDGEKVKIKAKECTEDNAKFVFKGKGMPDVNTPSIRGDYTVIIKYIIPKKLTQEQKDKLKNF